MATNGAIYLTEKMLLQQLAAKFPSPEYAFLPQVRNGTGFERSPRTADALVMGLWPSRGIFLHGFEIKVSRGDWLRELKQPAKAEAIAQYCDSWWIVSARGVVQHEEVPATWGLLESDGKKLVTRPAEKQPADPVPMDRLFLASILRNVAAGMVPITSIQDRIDHAVRVCEDRYKAAAKSEDRHAASELAKLRADVDLFEHASGVRIDRWQAKRQGQEFAEFLLAKAQRRMAAESARETVKNLRLLLDDAERIEAGIGELVAVGNEDVQTED